MPSLHNLWIFIYFFNVGGDRVGYAPSLVGYYLLDERRWHTNFQVSVKMIRLLFQKGHFYHFFTEKLLRLQNLYEITLRHI